jgi:hypothetical protein
MTESSCARGAACACWVPGSIPRLRGGGGGGGAARTWLKPVKQAMATMALMPHGRRSQLRMRAVCVDTSGFCG